MLSFACAILMALLVWRGLALQRAGLSLHFDEAQYWVWSTGLDWGYYSKPPVIAWIYRAAGLMLGHDAWGFRLTSGLLYALSAGVVGLIARDSFGSRVGVPAALAFASIPGIAVSAGFLTTDAPLVLCWALALLTLQRACGTQGHLGHWLGLGVATGFGLMSKYTMGAVAISALGWLLSRPEGRAQFRRAGPWCALAIAALLFAPNLLWNAHNGFPTLGHTQEISQLDRAGLHPMRLLEFILGQWVVGGPLLALAAINIDDNGRILVMFASFVITLALFALLAALSKGGIGGGDVRLAPVLAMFLGWLGASHVYIGLGSGFILGGIAAAGMLITRRASTSTRIAFGPFLCIGAVIALFVQ